MRILTLLFVLLLSTNSFAQSTKQFVKSSKVDNAIEVSVPAQFNHTVQHTKAMTIKVISNVECNCSENVLDALAEAGAFRIVATENEFGVLSYSAPNWEKAQYVFINGKQIELRMTWLIQVPNHIKLIKKRLKNIE